MTTLNKFKWVLGIIVVFLLILMTNLIDRNNFRQLKESVETIYDDRLVAKGVLFEISNLLHQKEIAFLKQDTVFFDKKNLAINESIDELIDLFSGTRLTSEEKKTLDKLMLNFKRLKDIGTSMEMITVNENDRWMSQLAKVKENIVTLSEIQITEAEKKVLFSKRAMDIVDLFSKIEIYFLIFLALLIQFIVIYSPRKSDS